LRATNRETGDTVTAEAVRGKEVGRFTIEATFPSEGTWEWEIKPDPLMGEGVFPPLTVLAPVAVNPTVKEAEQPAVVAPAAPSTTVTASTSEPIIRSGLQWAAVALLVVAIALLVIQRRSTSTSKLGTQGSGD
jgi:hypothetical protein